MEKLLELLNEYTNGRFKTEEDLKLCIEMNGYRRHFIQRLVDNDKIRKDIYRPIPLRIKATYEDGVVYHDKLEDRIIMLLSISDTPIEDLISYLK